MGPFDKKADNSFDRMFDMDRDGYLSASEEAMKYNFLDSFDSSSDDDDDDDFDEFGDSDDFDSDDFGDSDGFDDF